MNSYNVRTYKDAEKYLGGRHKAKVVNNTFIIRRDDNTIALRFYDTDVVTYTADGFIVLQTGGWRTATTKERLNAFSPYGVYVKRNVWYVSLYEGKGVHKIIGKFMDGMKLPAYTNGAGGMSGAAEGAKEYNAFKEVAL